MPTTVHIPKEILKAVDRRAKALGVSRNRFIVNALEKELNQEDSWPAGFFEKLTPLSPEDSKAFRESIDYVVRSRNSKKPPEF